MRAREASDTVTRLIELGSTPQHFHCRSAALDFGPEASLANYAAFARRYGLRVTDAFRPPDRPTDHGPSAHIAGPPRRSSTMPSQNPYDRRNPPRRDHGFADGRMMVAGEALRLEAPDSTLTLDDLDAMAANVAARTRRVEREEASIQQSEAVRDAMRVAWDEGSEAGFAGGRSEMLRRIAEQWEKPVKGIREKLHNALYAESTDEAISDEERLKMLRAAATDAHSLLVALENAHHRSFVPDR